MTELDWIRDIDKDPSGLVRLIYADWLEEKGLSLQSDAQRLLFLSQLSTRGNRWVIDLDRLPQGIRLLFLAHAENREMDLALGGKDRITEITTEQRIVVEAVAQSVVCSIAKSKRKLFFFFQDGEYQVKVEQS